MKLVKEQPLTERLKEKAISLEIVDGKVIEYIFVDELVDVIEGLGEVDKKNYPEEYVINSLFLLREVYNKILYGTSKVQKYIFEEPKSETLKFAIPFGDMQEIINLLRYKIINN